MTEPATPTKRKPRAMALLALKVAVTLGLLDYLARSIVSRGTTVPLLVRGASPSNERSPKPSFMRRRTRRVAG